MLIEAGDSRAVLRVGEWSDWLKLEFHPLPGGLMPLEGIVRFYVRQIRPGLEIYASPVNISPAKPAQDISTPSSFAKELYSLLGYFYTQGMPEDTNALKDRIFNDDDYQRQVALVQQDATALDLARRALQARRHDLHVPVGHRPAVPHALAPRRSEGTPTRRHFTARRRRGGRRGARARHRRLLPARRRAARWCWRACPTIPWSSS